MMKKRRLYIVGGANGSGKTTFARELVVESGIRYLGADKIAAELNAESPESVAIEAARVFSRRLNEAIENGESLLVESTLSGLSLKKFLLKAKENEFRISIYFVYLDSAELCVQRIASRVARGGHHVPEADVRRRFSRSNQNFWNVYMTLADDWNLFFNVGDGFRQIAVGDEKGMTIFDEERYLKWLEMAAK